jgi:hypothetical protein
MQSVVIDIINKKAIKLLQDLELLQLIRMRKEKKQSVQNVDWSARYKGAISRQSISDIDQQLNELRNGWE